MTPTWSTARPAPEEEKPEEKSHDDSAPVLVGEGGPTEAGWHSAEAGIWCLQEAQYKYIRGISLPHLQTPDHFAVGGMLHAGRATWFGSKFDTSQATIDAVKAATLKAADSFSLPVTEDAKKAATKYVLEYVEFWSGRPRPQPLAAEYLVGPAPVQVGDQFPLWRTARLDDVSRYPEASNKLAIGEAKTTSGSIDDCINQYTLHGQPILQFVLWGTSEQGERRHGPLAGFVLDIIKKGYGKDRSKFAREFVEVTPKTLEWYRRSLRAYLRRFANLDWNSDADDQRNIMACTRMVGRARMACEYRPLCRHGKAAASNYVLRDGTPLNEWKPSPGNETEPWK